MLCSYLESRNNLGTDNATTTNNYDYRVFHRRCVTVFVVWTCIVQAHSRWSWWPAKKRCDNELCYTAAKTFKHLIGTRTTIIEHFQSVRVVELIAIKGITSWWVSYNVINFDNMCEWCSARHGTVPRVRQFRWFWGWYYRCKHAVIWKTRLKYELNRYSRTQILLTY